jgi:serine/threonine protein kinase/Flp pilus assembly protein TadD
LSDDGLAAKSFVPTDRVGRVTRPTQAKRGYPGTPQLIGQTIAHYRIHAKLGEGGMGAVYRAEDLTLGREVALKFLSRGAIFDPEARRRLVKEAQAASRLNHPNIATIYELNVTDAVPFIVMELVPGRTLKEKLRLSSLSSAELLTTMRQIAEGLHEAHRAGVCHLDIKPGNIMLDARSRVKILDFGLAQMSRGEAASGGSEDALTETAADEVAGTVPYMSPEQLRGASPGEASDIFSFGVVLYECLSGRRPFEGETSVDVLHAILRTPHIPLSRLLPDIDADWEILVDRCLAKSPAQRWRGMGEVLAALERVAAPSQRPEKSIAVLYFANLSGNQADEYFRDGMTEDIITELTKIKALTLLPRSAVLALRDKPLDRGQVGLQLGVAYVLDGSLRRAGNRLRVTAQLAETRTGHSVWAERYDREMADVFAIQDEIAQHIANALLVVLSDQEKRQIEKVPTSNIQAYDYYLRGRKVFFEFRRKSFEYARQMFARATIFDPGYAAAFAGIANCCALLYMYLEATEENLNEAVAASRRAVALDPESAEAHASRGLAESLSKNYTCAEDEFEIAIHLNPRLYEPFYFYGRSCFAQGKMEKAAELFGRASALDPADYQSLVQLGQCLRVLGRGGEERRVNEEATRTVERHIEANPTDARAFYLGAIAYLQLGNRDRCLEWSQRALTIDPEETGTLYNVACIHSLLGEGEQALDLLEVAVRHGFGHKEWLENDPDFATLRDHPRFRTLVQSMHPAS